MSLNTILKIFSNKKRIFGFISSKKTGISIEIEENGNDLFKIKTSGKIANKITDGDKKKFGLSDEILKEAVRSFKGRRPTDVYLRYPTSLGVLYSKDNLHQPKKITKVKQSAVMDVRTHSTVLKTETFENKNSSVSTTHSSSIERTVSNSATSSWYNETNLSFNQLIGYNIKMINAGTALRYSRGWGSTETKSSSVTLKSGSSSQMTLNPGESTTIEWKIDKKIVRIKITYECHLEGMVGIYYHKRYQKNGVGKPYYIHFDPIEKIMEAGEIENSVIVEEVIEIELYTGISTIVK